MAETSEQLTLPDMSPRDLAWIDPSVIEMRTAYDLGEISDVTFEATLKTAEMRIAQRGGQG